MASTVTEGYVQARTDQAKAETEVTIAEAMLSVERQFTQQTLWLVAVIIGSSIGLAGLLIAVLK